MWRRAGCAGINGQEKREVSGLLGQCGHMWYQSIGAWEVGVELDGFPERGRVVRNSPPRGADVTEKHRCLETIGD